MWTGNIQGKIVLSKTIKIMLRIDDQLNTRNKLRQNNKVKNSSKSLNSCSARLKNMTNITNNEGTYPTFISISLTSRYVGAMLQRRQLSYDLFHFTRCKYFIQLTCPLTVSLTTL